AAASRAVLEARDALERRGAKVVPFTPPNPLLAMCLFYEILVADGGRGFLRFLDGSRQDFRIRRMLAVAAAPRATAMALRLVMRLAGRRKFEALLRFYGRHDTARHWEAVAQLKGYRADFLGALDRGPSPIDVILSPACGLPALRHGAAAELGVIGSYTALYN